MKLKCGYPIKKWNAAKREAKAVLIERAKAGDVIPYVELTRNITAIQLEPRSFALTTMLREIAAEEHAAGRGMLTAIVVYSSGDMQPGPGFFDLAGRLGRNTNDILRCWIKELKRVYSYWSKARGKQTLYRR
jgi:hypothetical protein